MTKRWWEYQKALNPVRRWNGHGSFTKLLRNQWVASKNAMAMRTNMMIPVKPTGSFKMSRYVGCVLKSSPKYLKNLS